MEKNINAIQKIISELALRDFNADKRTKKQKIKAGYTGYIPSDELSEAREVMYNYLSDAITEDEYKAYCLKYNLRTV